MDESDRELEILNFELEQAREDNRDASNQFWQATAVGVAAIAFILAFYGELIGGDNRLDIPSIVYILLIASVSIATFSYATSVSMKAAIRYQYIRHLENRIRELTNARVLSWTQLIAPVETLNFRHVSSPISLAHFLNVFFAILFTIITCLLIIIIFCADLPDKMAIPLGILIYLPFGSLFIYTAWFSSSNSLSIYKLASEQARVRLYCESEGRQYCPNSQASPWYFLFPRTGELQKSLFILLGMVFYVISCGTEKSDLLSYFLSGTICIFVFDTLVYQARYQWNDIREVVEDEQNPRAFHRKRLMSTGLPIKHAVYISLVILLYKLLLAMAILAYNSKTFGIPLAICCCLVILTAVLYEYARTKNSSYAVILLVPIGYVLRFFAGFLSFASTQSRDDVLKLSADVVYPLISIAFATYAFGMTFVTISWALAGVDWHSETGKKNPKSHIEYLYKLVGEADSYDLKAPLNCRGRLLTPWNIAMTISMLILLDAAISIDGSPLTITFSSILLFSLGLRISSKRWGRYSTWPIMLILFSSLLLYPIPFEFRSASIYIPNNADSIILIACIYLMTFCVFRNLNYELMLDPFVDLRPKLRFVVECAASFFFGQGTVQLLTSHKNVDGL